MGGETTPYHTSRERERERELRVSERVLCYTDEEVIRGNGVVILEEGREAWIGIDVKKSSFFT